MTSRNQRDGKFAGRNAGKAVRDKMPIVNVMSFGDMGRRRAVRKRHKIADKHNGGW